MRAPQGRDRTASLRHSSRFSCLQYLFIRLRVLQHRFTGFNIVLDLFLENTRRPPNLESVRETSAALLLVNVMLLSVQMQLPANIQTEHLKSMWRERTNETIDSPQWVYLNVMRELVFYHCLAETCLFFSCLTLGFLAMYCGLADTQLHCNEMLHLAWWRKTRMPFLSACTALVLGIVFSKLALTRADILVWPWPDSQLIFGGSWLQSTLSSALAYTWCGRTLGVALVFILFRLGGASKAMLAGTRTASTAKLKNRLEQASSTGIVLSRPEVVGELSRYLKAIPGGAERADQASFEDFLLLSSMRKSRRAAEGIRDVVRARTAAKPRLSQLTRLRARDVFDNFIAQKMKDEREQCETFEAMLLIQELTRRVSSCESRKSSDSDARKGSVQHAPSRRVSCQDC